MSRICYKIQNSRNVYMKKRKFKVIAYCTNKTELAVAFCVISKIKMLWDKTIIIDSS